MILGFSALQRTGLRDGLLAFYKLSNTSDSSGRGNTLTNNDGVTFVAGKIGNAAEFDTTNYLSRAAAILNGASAATITCWFKITGENNEYFLIAGGETEESFSLVNVDGDIKGFFTNTGDNFFAGAENAQDGEWHFAAIRYTPTTFKIWCDGSTNEQTGTYNAIGDSEYFSIGANWDGEFLQFDGQIDAVGIWNRALSDGEIDALYNNGTGRELP